MSVTLEGAVCIFYNCVFKPAKTKKRAANHRTRIRSPPRCTLLNFELSYCCCLLFVCLFVVVVTDPGVEMYTASGSEGVLRAAEAPLFWLGALTAAWACVCLGQRLLSGLRVWVLGGGRLMAPSRLGTWAGETPGHRARLRRRVCRMTKNRVRQIPLVPSRSLWCDRCLKVSGDGSHTARSVHSVHHHVCVYVVWCHRFVRVLGDYGRFRFIVIPPPSPLMNGKRTSQISSQNICTAPGLFMSTN